MKTYNFINIDGHTYGYMPDMNKAQVMKWVESHMSDYAPLKWRENPKQLICEGKYDTKAVAW